MWCVETGGVAGALIARVFSFRPPPQITTCSPVGYVGTLLAGSAIFAAIPFAIHAFHKPTWKAADSDFEAFEKPAATSSGKPPVAVGVKPIPIVTAH